MIRKDSTSSVYSHASNGSNSQASSSTATTTADSSKTKKKNLFEIDFIGGETYRVSQNYLLQKRSLEPITDSLAALSARGLYHRDRDYFSKELAESTQIIKNLSKQGSAAKGGSHQLYSNYYQRALALERLGQTDRAIEDYTTAIRNDRSQSQALFNRSGLYQSQGKYELALKDLNKAVYLEPSNKDYRMNRALLYRRMERYIEAIEDTMIHRALELQPHVAKDLEQRKEIKLDADVLGKFKKVEDPILRAFKSKASSKKAPKIDAIIDYIRKLKFFSKFSDEIQTLTTIAEKLELMHFKKGQNIFQEGDRGMHFFIILDGEVSIFKTASDGFTKNFLVKLFRGQTFGETALESRGGTRTAGAVASQDSNLMALHVDHYQAIMQHFDSFIKDEIRQALHCCPIFSDWEISMIEHLASCGITRNYSAGSVIIKYGEKSKNLYIVKTGVAEIVKRIDKPATSVNAKYQFKNPDSESEREAPGNWVLETNWKNRLGVYGDKEAKNSPCTFVTAIIGSGQVFGELAILDPEMRAPTSAVAYTNLELYCFDSDSLVTLGARFNTKTMNALNESLNLANPPSEKLAFYFRAKMGWETSKKKLLNKMETDGLLKVPQHHI